MSESITNPVRVEIGGRTLHLRFSKRAQYRLQGIPRNTDFFGISNPERSFATLCNWIWACAVDCPFETPEDIAAEIKSGEGVKAVKALVECIEASSDTATEKK